MTRKMSFAIALLAYILVGIAVGLSSGKELSALTIILNSIFAAIFLLIAPFFSIGFSPLTPLTLRLRLP